MSRYTKEELEMLTDEEREALEEDLAEDDAELASTETPAAEPVNMEASIPEDSAQTEQEEQEEDLPEKPDVAADSYNPALVRYRAPENSEIKLQSINDELVALATQFDEGEITAAEHLSAQQRLHNEQRAIETAALKAELAYDQEVNQWMNKTVRDFMNTHPEYQGNQTALTALDTAVKQIQANQPANMFDPAILKTAHERLTADLERLAGHGKAIKQPTPPPVQRDMPPNLSHVPAADTADVDEGGKAAYLDRLADQDPIKFEQEMMRLSDTELENYLAGR